jgi:hypothetical protein
MAFRYLLLVIPFQVVSDIILQSQFIQAALSIVLKRFGGTMFQPASSIGNMIELRSLFQMVRTKVVENGVMVPVAKCLDWDHLPRLHIPLSRIKALKLWTGELVPMGIGNANWYVCLWHL